MISFKVVYLSMYWSDRRATGEPVPEDKWRTMADGYLTEMEAVEEASRWAREGKQVHAVVKVTEERVIVIDPVETYKPGIEDRR